MPGRRAACHNREKERHTRLREANFRDQTHKEDPSAQGQGTPSTEQRHLDKLLEKNSEGTITPAEKTRLRQLVAEAERLMVANAQLLARFSQREGLRK